MIIRNYVVLSDELKYTYVETTTMQEISIGYGEAHLDGVVFVTAIISRLFFGIITTILYKMGCIHSTERTDISVSAEIEKFFAFAQKRSSTAWTATSHHEQGLERKYLGLCHNGSS